MKRSLGPILIPSWRFFDRVGTFLRLETAWMPHALVSPSEKEWRPIYSRPAVWSFNRALLQLFWNPAGNESLYLVTLMEKIVSEESSEALTELRRRVELAVSPPQPHYLLVFRIKDGDDIVYLSDPVKPGGPDA